MLSRIIDKYKIINKIKNGGQKTVYLAENIETKNRVILKEGIYIQQESFERIKREIETLKDIDSEYYPKNIEFENDSENKKFFVIEEYIEHFDDNGIGIFINNETELVKLLLELIEALKILWDKNIFHRDLKPDNILIKFNKKPVIIDLGIAKLKQEADLTNPFAYYGPCTPNYASPEQLRNQSIKVSMKTDFFLLGIYILEHYFGYNPFDPTYLSGTNSIQDNILNGIYVSPNVNNADPNFTKLIEYLLKVEQYQRFPHYKTIIEFINKNFKI
ncbi:MAG TPA: protein kinase [Ignavibacteria bacterium]|nr:protein kinase [Ignavibacteria bacterium]